MKYGRNKKICNICYKCGNEAIGGAYPRTSGGRCKFYISLKIRNMLKKRGELYCFDCWNSVKRKYHLTYGVPR